MNTSASLCQQGSASRSGCVAAQARHQDPHRPLTPHRLEANHGTSLNRDNRQDPVRTHPQRLAREGNEVLSHSLMVSPDEVNSRRDPALTGTSTHMNPIIRTETEDSLRQTTICVRTWLYLHPICLALETTALSGASQTAGQAHEAVFRGLYRTL